MMQRQFEAYNVTAPYQGSTGLAVLANILVNQTAQAINLSDYFGKLASGHYFTVQAEGNDIHIAVAPHSGQAINPATQGTGPAVSFPIPAGQMVPFTLQGGRTMGTGGITGAYATNINYASGAIIWAVVPSRIATGVIQSPTGYLRIWRNSVGPTQGLEEFPPKGFPNPIPT